MRTRFKKGKELFVSLHDMYVYVMYLFVQVAGAHTIHTCTVPVVHTRTVPGYQVRVPRTT